MADSLLFLSSPFHHSHPSSCRIVNHQVPSEAKSQREPTNTITCNRSKKPKLRTWNPGQDECWMGKSRYLEREGPYSALYKRKTKYTYIGKVYFPPTSTTFIWSPACSPQNVSRGFGSVSLPTAHATGWHPQKHHRDWLGIDHCSKNHRLCAAMLASPTKWDLREIPYKAVFLRWNLLIPLGPWRGIIRRFNIWRST